MRLSLWCALLLPVTAARAADAPSIFPPCAKGTWCATGTRGGSGWPAGTFAASAPNDIWVYGDEGVAHRWDGSAWKTHPLGGKWTLFDMEVFSPASAVAVGGVVAAEQVLLQWDGKTWTRMPVDLTGVRGLFGMLRLWGTSPKDLWLFGEQVRRLREGKLSEVKAPTGMVLTDGAGRDAKEFWAAGRADGGALTTAQWTGATFRQVKVPDWAYNASFHFGANGEVWLAADSNQYKLKAGKWHKATGVDFPNGNFAGGPTPLLYFSNELRVGSGAGFQKLAGPGQSISSAWAFSPSDIWVSGSSYTAHFDGKRWTGIEERATTGDLTGISARPGGPVYAAGRDGLLLRFDGKTWTKLPTMPEPPQNTPVIDAGPLGLWVGAQQFRNGAWVEAGPAENARLMAMWAQGNRELWAVGRGAWRWDGKQWERVLAAQGDGLIEEVTGDGKDRIWLSLYNPSTWSDARQGSKGKKDAIIEVSGGKQSVIPMPPYSSRIDWAGGALWAMGPEAPMRWNGKVWEVQKDVGFIAGRVSRMLDTPTGPVFVNQFTARVQRGGKWVDAVKWPKGAVQAAWSDGQTIFVAGDDGLLMHAALEP